MAESVSQQFRENQKWEIQAIPNGCSMPIWKYNQVQKDELRHKLGLERDPQYFIFIGRLSKEKNPDIITKAFNSLHNKNIKVLFLGDGPMWQQLNDIKTASTIFLGLKKNIYEYLISADYYISASDVEGLANTLLESMPVGLPMVLSDIPSHKEVATNNKLPIASFFNPKDEDQLKHAVENIVLNNEDITTDTIQSIYKKHYLAEEMSKKYQHTYISIL